MANYLTESDLENYILQDISPNFSAWITSVIAMVEAYINQYCETDFENSASSSRYFDSFGEDELYIGDIQSVTEVLILDANGNTQQTLTENTDYYLYPPNETIKSIIKLSPGGTYGNFPERTRAVKVTGVWGYSSVPTPVKLAGIKLAAKIINEGLRGGKISAETLGSYSVNNEKVDETVDVLGIREILNQYRKINLDAI